MELAKLNAQRRIPGKKGASRQLRAKDLIPAVVYGKDTPSAPLTISPKDLMKILDGDRGINTVIQIQIDGKDEYVGLLSEYQLHPVTRGLLHVDFRTISLEAPVDVDVPLTLPGKAKGITLGGELRQAFRKLPIRCLPKDIPAEISHDITEVGLDEAIPVSALSLPEGVTVRLRPTQTIAGIYGKKRRGGDEAEESAEAAAAPAAGADAAKKEPAKK